jgi:hypothetical protein
VAPRPIECQVQKLGGLLADYSSGAQRVRVESSIVWLRLSPEVACSFKPAAAPASLGRLQNLYDSLLG